MLQQIGDVLAKLDDDTLNEISQQSEESEIDVSHAIVNLRRDRSLIKGLFENGTIQQFPLRFQEHLLERINAVINAVSFVEEISIPDIAMFTRAIEEFHYFVWSHELEHKETEFLGYEAKLNQLKFVEQETEKRRLDLNKLVEDINEANLLLATATKLAAETKQTSEEAKVAQDAILNAKEAVEELQTTATEKEGQIKSSNDNATTLIGKIEGVLKTSQSYQTQLKEYHGEMNANRKALEETMKEHREFTAESKKRQKEIIDEFSEQREKVADLLAGAISSGLFRAFEQRKDELVLAKARSLKWFVGSAIVFLLLGIAILLELYGSNTAIDKISWQYLVMRISLLVPVGFAVGFFSVQYNKERRLEEEYAFKSNVSLSLEAYRKLVKSMVEEDKPNEREQYIKFVTESVGKVFSPPKFTTAEVHDGESGVDEKSLKTLNRLITSLKPLLDGLRK